jgi:hypothetical protein
MLDYVSPKGEGGTCSKSGSLAAAFAAGLPIFATKGDMTNQLLLNQSNVIWLEGHRKINADLIRSHLNHLNRLKFITNTENNVFYMQFLSWNIIAKKIFI